VKDKGKQLRIQVWWVRSYEVCKCNKCILFSDTVPI